MLKHMEAKFNEINADVDLWVKVGRGIGATAEALLEQMCEAGFPIQVRRAEKAEMAKAEKEFLKT